MNIVWIRNDLRLQNMVLIIIFRIGLEDEPQERIFTANHPFLYFVYDEATHAILLMGQFCGDGAIFD